jgi:membrane protease YdiL (CAAX protease family)
MTRAVSPGVRSAKPTTTDLNESESPSLKAGYFQASEQPLASLFFVLPMIIVYEIGTRWYATDPVHGTEERIIAFNLMRQFFNVLGAHGRYLPCFAVVAILFTIHLFRKDSWVVQPTTLLGMGFESVLLVIPLLLAGQMVIHYLQHLTLVALDMQDREMIVTFFGAGIYEEMVFRLAGFALLSLLFRDVLKLNKQLSMLLIVVCSGILFSLYHYLGNEQFQWPSFVFRTFAGIYFGVIMMARGFGVTAGTHTAYDIIVWCMR